jgi:tetratricopeptide (TPR) repeat protein
VSNTVFFEWGERIDRHWRVYFAFAQPFDILLLGEVNQGAGRVEFADKLFDAVTGALPGTLKALIPEDVIRRARARLRDVNPFAILPNDDDLPRAVRLAWIGAALALLDAARKASDTAEWRDGQRADHRRFYDLTQACLRGLRDSAYDRDTPLTACAIDAHGTAVVQGDPSASQLAESFGRTLAALVAGGDVGEIPPPLIRLAADGLPPSNGAATGRRDFSALVFNEFARLLTDPAAFPEGRAAMDRLSVRLASQTLAAVRDSGARLNATLDALSLLRAGLAPQLALLPEIAAGVERADSKLDRLLALAEADGAVARAADAGFTKAVVVALIERMDHLGIQANDLIPWVDSAIDRLRAWKPETTGDAAFDALCAEAARLFNEGRINAPAALFRAERDRLRKARIEDERRLLLQEIHYNEAAINPTAVVENLRELAALDGVTGADALGDWLFAKAYEYYERGDQKGDNTALLIAIAAYQDTLKERTRERAPLDWAMTQNNLGAALKSLGDRESGTARLEQAADAYRNALEERTRERAPLQWAMTQNNLGNALQSLGARESGTARLEQAVDAYRNALEEYTRERAPLDWATIQNNLGNALSILGERESGTARLEQAVDAFRNALDEYTRDRTPLDWAMTQNNLGNALSTLGERESGTARLEQAVDAYRNALEERTRQRVPLDWAMTQNNLGIALGTLGERESDTARLEQAVDAYRDALEERTRERAPLRWGMSFGNQGVALIALAERRDDGALAERALRQITEARALFDEAGHVHAAYYARQMEQARVLVARLRGGG